MKIMPIEKFFKLKPYKLFSFLIIILLMNYQIFNLLIRLFVRTHNDLQNNKQFISFDSDIYLYSCYCIDSRIIIIAIIKNNTSDEYNCEVSGNSVNAQIIELPEHHFTIYR
jgi:hypothetical protein